MLPRRSFAIEPKSKLRRGNMVQRCSKHSRLLLAERALKTALSLFPKRHRLDELRSSGLGQIRLKRVDVAGPADALLPNHGCHPPLMLALTLTIDAYAIISNNACIC